MTKSKTQLIKVERKFTLKRADVEKTVLEVYAELGITLPKKTTTRLSAKA